MKGTSEVLILNFALCGVVTWSRRAAEEKNVQCFCKCGAGEEKSRTYGPFAREIEKCNKV
jgi:hypothetical protein